MGSSIESRDHQPRRFSGAGNIDDDTTADTAFDEVVEGPGQIIKTDRPRQPGQMPWSQIVRQTLQDTAAVGLADVAQRLNALASPNEAVFYTSGRASNEAAYLYQLFVRRFGTNNLPDCSNMCHESSGVGLNETIGIGKGTVSLDDLHNAGLVIVMGQNPGTNHPRMLSALAKCVENGGRVVSVNPLPEAGTQRFVNPQSPMAVLKGGTALSSLHIGLRINTDVALLKGVMRLLLDREEAKPGTVFDRTFINERTERYDAFINELRNVDAQRMADTCGVPVAQFHELAELICSTEKIIITWAMGLTQHVNAVANIRQIVNLLLLRGAFGKPGAGACPVRGHSNVQGDRTMGIYEKPAARASCPRGTPSASPSRGGC